MSYKYRIDKDRCKGCGLCVDVCPRDVLELSSTSNDRGYFPAYQAHEERCIKCKFCAVMCPDMAITIIEVEDTD